MKTSSEITNITKALVEAHKSIGHAVKDAKNPHFRNDYATLESVIDASKKSLLDNGIIVVQSLSEKSLVTRIQHTSGEFFESTMELLVDKQNMQGVGSAITYARRYSLASILNISQADDDGQTAVFVQAKKPQSIVQPTKKFIPLTAPDLPLPKEYEIGPGDFMIGFGMYKGKMLKELDFHKLVTYIDWIPVGMQGKDGQPVTGKLKEQMLAAQKAGQDYIATFTQKKDLTPVFNDKEEIPF